MQILDNKPVDIETGGLLYFFTMKATIEKINVDEKPEEASKYGVMSIPTYIILKDAFLLENCFVCYRN